MERTEYTVAAKCKEEKPDVKTPPCMMEKEREKKTCMRTPAREKGPCCHRGVRKFLGLKETRKIRHHY